MPADGTAPPSLLASMAGPLRLAGTLCWGLAALFLVVVVVVLLAAGETFPWGALLAPAVLFGIGKALRVVAHRLEEGGGPELPTVAGWTFGAVGAAMLAGGVVLTFQDPGGLALMAFGGVFMGAGWLTGRLFGTPQGMKALTVSSHEAEVVTTLGRPATRRSGVRIFVDENATDEEVGALRRRWQDEQWTRRADWLAGRVEDENARGGGLLALGAGLWSLFALGFLAVAVLGDDPFWWWVAGPGTVVAAALIVAVMRERMHRSRFRPGHFVMRETPARLGGRLEGEVETGVLQRMRPPDGFRVRLECVHRWEERSGGDRRTHARRDVLWSEESRVVGRPFGAAPTQLAVDVAFHLPATQPASSPGSGSDGVSWELHVHAPLPGLDYRARFKLPVLPVEG